MVYTFVSWLLVLSGQMNCLPVCPSMFKNLYEAYLWLKVRPVLMNGKIRLTGLPYFILATKNMECKYKGLEVVC